MIAHRPVRSQDFLKNPWFRVFDWDKVLVAVIAALHLWASATLVLAPHVQLFTQGTRPMFALFPPTAWAVGFVIGGIATAFLAYRVTAARQVFAWFAVCPVQTMWLGASVLAVTRGGGSAMEVVFLSAVLAFTVVIAIKVAVDFTSGKR